MKKISKLTLRKIDVEQSDILQKRELKYILGGYGSSGSKNVCCKYVGQPEGTCYHKFTIDSCYDSSMTSDCMEKLEEGKTHSSANCY